MAELKQAICKLSSLAAVQQSKFIATPRKDKETAQDHEARCWKERAHVNERGRIILPAIAFRHCITDAARFLGSSGALQIPGRGKATYTKHFEAGIMVANDIETEYTLDTVKPLWLLVPSDGRRGGGSRVQKCFPVIERWAGTLIVNILDNTITKEVFERVIREAGNFIGIGAWRLQNRGNYGRFLVEKITWENLDLTKAA